jgi:uracil-DNA glycosylase family 4
MEPRRILAAVEELLRCTDCPRLASHLADVRREHPDYHALPVPQFGDEQAPLLIVGLAPGMHGANRTGRPFTGDFAGILLYETLYEFGFASRPKSTAGDDGLVLFGCRITNAVKCLPPKNKPKAIEVNTCNRHLKRELDGPSSPLIILALGAEAHKAVLRALGLPKRGLPFSHGARHKIGDRILFDSYHCSRINTQTRRLTRDQFRDVFRRIRREL